MADHLSPDSVTDTHHERSGDLQSAGAAGHTAAGSSDIVSYLYSPDLLLQISYVYDDLYSLL